MENAATETGRPVGAARWLRQPRVAIALVAAVSLDVLANMNGSSHHGCVTRIPHANVFRTPQGVHLVGRYSAEWEQLGLDENAYEFNAPPNWECVGEITSLPGRRAEGLLSRWDDSVVAAARVNEWGSTPLSASERATVRAAFAGWLSGPEWGGEFYTRAAALIAAGGGSDDQIKWPYLVHDGAMIVLACGAVYAFPALFPPSRRERRRRNGLCPDCGYPLYDLPEPGCPECGWGRENL